MTRKIVRSMAVMALAAGLIGGCGATSTSPSANTPAATTPSPTATPTATPSPADPWATPIASVGPMDPAYVTGKGTITGTVSAGTTTTRDGLSYMTGEELEGAVTASDPRVTGTTTLVLNGVAAASAAGLVGFEWGTLRIQNVGGAWNGTIKGAVWSDLNASDLNGFLVGSGAYAGLTYAIHVRGGASAESEGVIFPAPPPSTR